MLLDVLDYVFLLNFPLEATERTFNRFSVQDLHFCQPESTSLPDKIDTYEAKWL